MTDKLKDYRDTRTLVRQFTGLSEDEHNEFYFMVGSDWCNRNTIDDATADALATDPMFWAWWGQNWNEAEKGFLQQVSYDFESGCWCVSRRHPKTLLPMVLTGELLKKFYHRLMEAVMKDCRSNSVVLAASYRLKPVFNPLNNY